MGKRQDTRSQKLDDPGLKLAKRNFGPLDAFIEHLGNHVTDHKPLFSLERQADMHKIAQHTFETKYSLCKGGTDCLSLAFTVVGPDADKILFQRHKRSSPSDNISQPGQMDLHVYRLDELDRLKQIIQDKVISYVSS